MKRQYDTTSAIIAYEQGELDDGAWVTLRAFVSNEEAGVKAPEDA